MQDRTISRAGGIWEAGGALALPDLDRSVNPILTVADYAQHITTSLSPPLSPPDF